MAKVKAEQVNEQEQQGSEQDDSGQLQSNEQNNAMQSEEIHVAGDGVESQAERQPDSDGDDDGDYPHFIRVDIPSMRDMFAMAALQGMLANGTHQLRPDAVADKAFAFADAMLEVRRDK